MRALFALLIVFLIACNRPKSESRPTPRPAPPVDSSSITSPGGTAGASERLEPVTTLMINGEKLQTEDVLRPLRKELTEKAAALSPPAYRAHLREALISEFRDQARAILLHQEASKRLSDREKEAFEGFVDDEIRKKVNAQYGGRQTRYEKALIDEGLTLADDRERIRRQLVTLRHLHLTVLPRVTDPTRAELLRFWEEEKHKLVRPERRRMSLIEAPIGFDDTASGNGSLSRAEAADLIGRAKGELDGGADFAAVARKYSRGVHADSGGAWEFLTRGSVRERWERPVETLFTMSRGQVSPIIETPEAFFIVRCDEIDAPPPPDFEAMQPRLVEAYRDHQFNVLVDEKVKELQEKANFVPTNIGRFLEGVARAAPQPSR